MNSRPHREIACAIIIDAHGRFLLQQRDDISGILHPGKIGLFGGHREGDESFLECVAREIREETGYCVPPGRFEYLASIDGADIDVEGGSVRGDFFVVRDVPVEVLVITEGSLRIVPRERIHEVRPKLTPSARFALNAFLGGGGPSRL